jgi:hypothetical protein
MKYITITPKSGNRKSVTCFSDLECEMVFEESKLDQDIIKIDIHEQMGCGCCEYPMELIETWIR